MRNNQAFSVALVMCAAVVGCDSGNAPVSNAAMPVHGVLQVMGMTPPLGVSGQITFVAEAGRGKTTQVPAATNGTFHLQLPPGTYQVTAHSPSYGNNEGLCRPQDNIVVKAGLGLVQIPCYLS